ncbi:MAG TPA: SRPBCC family protein [Terracidiphilus sp.]|nr:SRPBCC family protein [Terracidiphilus sp.]
MSSFRTSIEIQTPAERVWAAFVDVEQWPRWTPTVTSIRLLDPGPLAVGSRAEVRQPRLPAAVWQVTGLDECAGVFTWVSRRRGVAVTATHCVEPTAAGSCATLSVDFSGYFGSLVARLMRDLTSEYVVTEAQGLKAFLEG